MQVGQKEWPNFLCTQMAAASDSSWSSSSDFPRPESRKCVLLPMESPTQTKQAFLLESPNDEKAAFP